MNERWRPILGADGYEVSDLGRVRSWRGPFGKRRRTPRLRKSVPLEKRGGYLSISFIREGRPSVMCVHHMVLTAFIGPKPEGKEARHRDGDPTNNALTNLRWSTHVENEKDKIGHGTHTRGERNGGAKLTQRQADSIRRRIANGEQARSIAREMGISEATVSRIKKGLRYAGRATLS